MSDMDMKGILLCFMMTSVTMFKANNLEEAEVSSPKRTVRVKIEKLDLFHINFLNSFMGLIMLKVCFKILYLQFNIGIFFNYFSFKLLIFIFILFQLSFYPKYSINLFIQSKHSTSYTILPNHTLSMQTKLYTSTRISWLSM